MCPKVHKTFSLSLFITEREHGICLSGWLLGEGSCAWHGANSCTRVLWLLGTETQLWLLKDIKKLMVDYEGVPQNLKKKKS